MNIASLKAQNGFIQTYDLYEEYGLSFRNLLLVEDTLVVFGSIANPDYPQWGVFFAKLDTLGDILAYETHYDTTGHSYVFEQGVKIISTNDGGYALIGNNFTNSAPLLFKLDVNGNLEFVKEYPDNTTWTKRHNDIIEIENGYISIGTKQQMVDGLANAFVMRTDKQGNKIWEINYGEVGLYEKFNGLRKINENEILLTGHSSNTSEQIDTYHDLWSKGLALRIDTLGNILWTWESEKVYAANTSTPAMGRIYSTNDGNWMSEGAYSTIDTIFGEEYLIVQNEIVKRDTNFNVIWSTIFGEPTTPYNNFIDIVQTPDGGWVAIGTYSIILDYNTYEGYRTGMMAKVNAAGDSLWSRVDTIFSPPYGSRPILSGAVVLPSGSIIACGQVDRYTPEPAKSFGWLIKVDKDGCIVPGCNPTTGLTLALMVDDFEIFPNPTTGFISIKGEGNFDVAVFGVEGKDYLGIKNISNETELDLRKLNKGIYFLQIKKDCQMITKKIVIN